MHRKPKEVIDDTPRTTIYYRGFPSDYPRDDVAKCFKPYNGVRFCVIKTPAGMRREEEEGGRGEGEDEERKKERRGRREGEGEGGEEEERKKRRERETRG